MNSKNNQDSFADCTLVEQHLDKTRRRIINYLDCPGEAGRRLNFLLNRGKSKMIRPLLLMLSAKTCGKIKPIHIEAAAIIELLHSATLFHDDVIDEAASRRAMPAANALWGNKQAILLGDILFSKVFFLSAKLKHPVAAAILAETTGKICSGELTQQIQCENFALTERQYLTIIADKSAELFKTSCSLGAILANATPAQTKTLSAFGFHLGLAFQIADDLLDVIGDPRKTGKTLGTDLRQKRLTLPLIHLLQALPKNRRAKLIRSLKNKSAPADTTSLLAASGSLKYSYNRASQEVKKAIKAVSGLKNPACKTALIETAQFVIERIRLLARPEFKNL